MTLLQRAWRKQRAINRVRKIRRFRKGRPKLGCYKCGYDCYEVRDYNCPECDTLIERDVTCWFDGHHSVGRLMAWGFGIGFMFVFGSEQLISYFGYGLWIFDVAEYAMYTVIFVLAYKACALTRSRRNVTVRSLFVGVAFLLGMLGAWIVLLQLFDL